MEPFGPFSNEGRFISIGTFSTKLNLSKYQKEKYRSTLKSIKNIRKIQKISLRITKVQGVPVGILKSLFQFVPGM